MVTITVASITDALKKIEDAGGSVVQPEAQIPGMGSFAYFKDSEGNVIGLWQNAEQIAPSDVATRFVGSLEWARTLFP